MNDSTSRILPRGLRRSAVAAPANDVEYTRPALSNRLLVVDDDSEIRSIIAVLLRGAGYRVDTASDGGAGWIALCAKPYDLLITDHLMPKITGLDLIRRVRAVPLDLPCILISGEMPWQAPDLATLLQPGGTLEKPFSLLELRDKVQALLGGDPAGKAVEFPDGTRLVACAV